MAAKISIIAAVARHHQQDKPIVVNQKKPVGRSGKKAIGINNALPWNIPADLRNFKRLTLGHPVIMGRKTFDSIGKPLPGRRNIVITRNSELRISGCEVVGSLPDAIRLAESQTPDEIFVIGGAQIYAQAMRIADCLYLTEVGESVKGDVFFPNFSEKEWGEKERIRGDAPLFGESHPRFDFVEYERTRADEN